MGGGIAMSFANAGVPVTLIESTEEQLRRGLDTIQKTWEAAARGSIRRRSRQTHGLIVRGPRTAPDALLTEISIARQIRKAPVVVGLCHGFVANRMYDLAFKQADKLIFEGASDRSSSD